MPVPPCRFADGRLRTFYHSDYFRSAAHGLRWWEFDVTYWTVRMMGWVGLARKIVRPDAEQPEDEALDRHDVRTVEHHERVRVVIVIE